MRSISVMHSDELAGDAKRRVPLPCKKELRMDAYARLDDEEKRQVAAAARNVTSKSEMNQIVRG